MARSPATGAGSVTEATTLIFPKKSTWDELAKIKRETKKRASSHNGIYGAAVKDAVEKDHVDRKALAIVLKLDEMEDDDLHVTVHHMIEGMKARGILTRAMAQEEMFSQHKIDAGALDGVKPPSGKKPPKDAKPGRKKNGHAGDNVVKLGDAARNVAEQAGGDK